MLTVFPVPTFLSTNVPIEVATLRLSPLTLPVNVAPLKLSVALVKLS
jgi:hypothetical protein